MYVHSFSYLVNKLELGGYTYLQLKKHKEKKTRPWGGLINYAHGKNGLQKEERCGSPEESFGVKIF